MKVIIAGSRDITNHDLLLIAIAKSGFTITEVVSGLAPGVDTLAVEFAELNDIPLKKFPAEWDKYGKSAGFRRNVQMADYADALIYLHDGYSKGTMHMINLATKRNLKIYGITLGDS